MRKWIRTFETEEIFSKRSEKKVVSITTQELCINNQQTGRTPSLAHPFLFQAAPTCSNPSRSQASLRCHSTCFLVAVFALLCCCRCCFLWPGDQTASSALFSLTAPTLRLGRLPCPATQGWRSLPAVRTKLGWGAFWNFSLLRSTWDPVWLWPQTPLRWDQDQL